MNDRPGRTGVLLMTYGSPASLETDDVLAYMTRVRHGREPGEALVTEFTRRYRVIGGSPLVEITRRQAAALSRRLGMPAGAGMRFFEPSIEGALGELADAGAEQVAAIILSPQFSPLLMGGYERAIAAARASLGGSAPVVTLAGAWHLQPDFIDGMVRRIRDRLAGFPAGEGETVPVLLTAHSLPRRIAAEEPNYLEQLEETAVAIATAAGLERDRWHFCWQSAGHEPGEWLKPDFADLMPQLAAAGHSSVLVAPVQFLADHLEILYDVDVGAREQAEAAGLRFARIASLNDAPELIAALAAVARETFSRGARRGPPAAVASTQGRTVSGRST